MTNRSVENQCGCSQQPANVLLSIVPAVPNEMATERSGILRRLGKVPWAVADQLLISATNFVTMVLLARGLSREDFGRFTLVYEILLFANALQSALVTQAHNVLGATRRGEDYARYTTSTAIGQVLLATIAVLLSLAAWAGACVAAPDAAPLLLALAPSILSWQLQEFVRRVLYTEGRLTAAFTNDLISYGVQAVAIAALWQQEALTAPRALHALAATSAVAVFLGAWQICGSLACRADPSAFLENWNYGKWLAASAVVSSWLSAELFIYIAAAVVGVAAAGILRAVTIVFGPTRVLAYVISSVLPIRFARMLADAGPSALRAELKTTYLLALPAMGGYCLLAAIFAEPLLRLLYREKYAGQASVLALYAVYTFIVYVAMIVNAALLANRQTRQVFSSHLYAGLISLPIGLITIVALGVHGAVLGMIANYAVVCLLLRRAYDAERTAPARLRSGPRTSVTPARH